MKRYWSNLTDSLSLGAIATLLVAVSLFFMSGRTLLSSVLAVIIIIMSVYTLYLNFWKRSRLHSQKEKEDLVEE